MMRAYKQNILIAAFFFVSTISVHGAELNARPLKILFVVGHFPSRSQIFILNIITGLIDKGHDVSIFAFHKDVKNKNVHPNIKKYQLLDRVIYEKLPAQLPDCDIVFCQFGYVGQKIAEMKQLRTWLKQRKMVVCFRGADITKQIQADPVLYKRMFKKVDLVLPVCDYFRKKLIALGCDPAKIVVHHSAIDCSQFLFNVKQKKENETVHLISVCRLVKKKGIDFAIKAIAQVVQKHPNIQFVIVGDGPERSYLELLIRQLKLKDKIFIYGWASHKEVVSFLKQSHIFLLPSRTGRDGNEEGIANALKEAMAMGLISIGTWHAGTPELIKDGISGFLVPEKNVLQLVQTIEHVIESPEKWESIAIAARKKVEDEFEIKKSIEELEKLFYRLLS
jgi:colanic acid/amylovoran biosynthesis glycosyltransferase